MYNNLSPHFRNVKLRIVNLQPSGRKEVHRVSEGTEGDKMRKKWEEIGVWQSWTEKWKGSEAATTAKGGGADRKGEDETEGGGGGAQSGRASE